MTRPKPTVYSVRQVVMDAMIDLLRGVPDKPKDPLLIPGFLEEVVVCLLDEVTKVDYEVVPLRGRASWMWEPFLELHLPYCRFVMEDGTQCLEGPLLQPLVPEGLCQIHRQGSADGMGG